MFKSQMMNVYEVFALFRSNRDNTIYLFGFTYEDFV